MADLELHLLGTTGLQAADGTDVRSVLAQPKRFALLAHLALAAPGRLQRRDSLLAMFWPELDADRARAALRDSLYFLRRHLGEAIVTRGGEEVGVDGARLRVDAVEFLQAVRQARHADAVAAYTGDLLTGFNLPGAPDFEAWLDAERTRLRGLAADAALRAAAGADGADAVRLCRRALELAPYDESALQQLLAALEKAGDHGGAVAAYEHFTARLARELEVAPSAETQARVERLRAAPVPSRTRVGPGAAHVPDAGDVVPAAHLPVAGDVVTAAHVSRASDVVSAGNASVRSDDASAAARATQPRAMSRRLIAALLAIFVVLASATAAWRGFPGLGTPAPEPAEIVVLPFSVHGGGDFLREGMVDLFGAKLDGAGVRTVDPQALFTVLESLPDRTLDLSLGRTVAQRFAARHFVMGSIVQAGSTLQVSAYLYDRDGRQVARANQVGGDGDVMRMVDELARELLAGHFRDSERMSEIAALTTTSLPALRAYLDGERFIRAGDFHHAMESLQQAIERDSTFALAYYRLSTAADYSGRADVAEPAARAAYRHMERLPRYGRQLVTARHEFWFGNTARAEALYLPLTVQRPDDIEPWFELGEVRFHAGPWFGQSFTAAEAAFRRVLELQPRHVAAAMHLGRIAAATHQPALLDSLIRSVAAKAPHANPVELRVIRAALLDSAAELDSVVRELAALPDDRAGALFVERAAVYTGNLAAAEQLARALLRPGLSRDAEELLRQSLSHILAGRGRWPEAREQLDALQRLNAPLAAHVRANIITSGAVEVPADEVAAAERALLALAPMENAAAPAADPAHFSEARRTYLLGLLAALRGADVEPHARTLETLAGDSAAATFARSLAGTLRARSLAQRGDSAAALRTLEAAWLPPNKPLMIGWAWTHSNVNARLFRAQLLLQQRRHAEALQWADATAEDIAGTPLVLARATLVRAAALRALGRSDEARTEEERYRRLVAAGVSPAR